MYYPKTAFLVLTTACNKRDACAHCFYNVEPDRVIADAPDTDQLITLMRNLRMTGFTTIILTGGEPTLRPDLPDLVKAASNFSLETLLLTNGSLINRDLTESLAEAGLNAAAISLTQFSQTERRAADHFSHKNLIPFSFTFCFNRETYSKISDAMNFARDYRKSLMYQPAYIPEGHMLENSLSMRAVDAFEWGKIYTMLRPWARSQGFDAYLKLMYSVYNENKDKPEKCSMSGNAIVINADGKLTPCFHRLDLDCGCVWGDGYSDAMSAWQDTVKQTRDAHCFGEHCLSLHTNID